MCGERQHPFRRFFGSEEYSITYYKLKDCPDLGQNEEATSGRYEWPSIRAPTTLDSFGLLDPPV